MYTGLVTNLGLVPLVLWRTTQSFSKNNTMRRLLSPRHLGVGVPTSMEEWTKLSPAKRPKRDQVTPERKRTHVLNTDLMWCGKCGVSHSPKEPCKYPDVLKSLQCSSCGSRQNDHVKGCPTVKRTTMIKICHKCGEEGHVQENYTLT